MWSWGFDSVEMRSVGGGPDSPISMFSCTSGPHLVPTLQFVGSSDLGSLSLRSGTDVPVGFLAPVTSAAEHQPHISRTGVLTKCRENTAS